MSATVIRIEDGRPTTSVETAWDEACRLLRIAQSSPSMPNMAKAVDAWRTWERAAMGSEAS